MTTPQLRPYVNFFGHFVDASMELDFLREFASRVEDLLVDGALRSSTGHRPLPDSIAAIAHDQQYLYTELFSPLLHESFVVSAVVFLERECRAFVEILAKALSVPLTLRDLNGSILERFRTFCSKVASLDLGVSQDLWQAVDASYRSETALFTPEAYSKVRGTVSRSNTSFAPTSHRSFATGELSVQWRPLIS